jgi:hypothetical protein
MKTFYWLLLLAMIPFGFFFGILFYFAGTCYYYVMDFCNFLMRELNSSAIGVTERAENVSETIK